MFLSGNDQALLNCCGVDHSVFRKLLQLFSPVFRAYTYDDTTGQIRRRAFLFTNRGVCGRKKAIDEIGCFGLVLFWFQTCGSVARSASLAFGMTSTPLYKWLKFSRKILLFVLQKHPHAAVVTPTQADVDKYVDAIGQKYESLREHKVWAAADGLKIPLAKSSKWRVQNQYYNGWTGDTYVNSVFVFSPDGKIQICTLNAPGTWHDSTIAEYGVYTKMEHVFETYGAKVVVDSAFNLSNKRYLIKSSQQDPFTPDGVVLNRDATSLRQLSEWGMRMIQGSFPRLKDKMPYEEFGERRVILNLMVLLYNYQTHNIGVNQILNVFMNQTEGFYAYGQVQMNNTANNLLEHE